MNPYLSLRELRSLWKYAKLIDSYNSKLRFQNIWHLIVEERMLRITIDKLKARNEMLQDELVKAKNVQS